MEGTWLRITAKTDEDRQEASNAPKDAVNRYNDDYELTRFDYIVIAGDGRIQTTRADILYRTESLIIPPQVYGSGTRDFVVECYNHCHSCIDTNNVC